MSNIVAYRSRKNIDKLTFAYFSASPGGAFTWEKWQMWRGISEAARQLDINLLYLAGEEFESHPQAVLYDLIGAHNVDGIIIWNSFVGPRTSIAGIQEFISRYAPLPIASIELALEGCANILLDEKQAIRDLLAHLIGEHHYKRIAFFSQEGSHPSTARQQAFEQVLDEYGLLDARLIGSMNDLDERGLTPGNDYQVVVAHADDEAIKAVDAFRKRGLRVPEDVAITGFNDGMDARGLIPPLTTIRLPFRKMGRKAVEILVEKIKQGENPKPVVFPVNLILRRSCGCVEPMAEKAWIGVHPVMNSSLRGLLDHSRQEIVNELSLGMGTTVESAANIWAEKFLDLFTQAISDNLSSDNPAQQPAAYLSGMQTILQQAVEEGANVSRWHEALTALRKKTSPVLSESERVVAEDLWQQARVLIGQSAVRAEINHQWRSMQRADILREMEAELLISFDFSDLLKILVRGLSRLELGDLYLVLYDNPEEKDGWARLVLAYRREKDTWMYAEGIRFQASDILPEGWIPDQHTYQLLIEDLQLGDEQIGYVLFHTSPPGDASMCDVFQALQIQLSSAVKGVKLRQKLQQALHQAEEANQLKSGFLSMVSHELRTPLNLIVGLSEMAMRQKARTTRSNQETLYKYLEQIYVSGQHLDRLIRDVLDLASSQVGQMNLVSQVLDLLPILRETSDMGRQLAEQKNLLFSVDFSPNLPKIWGDKTRLKQILLNLLSNAVKFTAHGEIRFTAASRDGEILISVSDTGLGIAREEQEVIFDEFRQSNRSMVRGYGGIGLGLAITRRLVEMHGGRIWVESRGTEDSGSAFSLTLPVLDQSIIQEPAPVYSREGVVLVLTKAEGTENALTQHLRKSGFVVEEEVISDNTAIVETLVAAPPGAVILDIAPAVEQGWMIIKSLKENPATQDLPVLFYSLVEENTGGAVLEMDYLTKPVGTDQLLRALKRHGLKARARGVTQNILMIDDDPGILDLQSRMIESKLPGCRVVTAQDGRLGMDLMRKETPDLVLLDLMMPEIDGFSVLKMMQEDPALRNIPVIVLSAQVLTRHDIQRLNQGVAAILSKGMFEPQEILSRVECVLSRNQKLGSEAQRLVYQAIGFIHEHYKDPISRPEIARALSINEQYLSRCFNKIMGIGPIAYLSRHRILQAKKLLDRKNLSITQVALEVGLSSQSYFSRIFQQEVGVTPSEYMHGKRAAVE